MGQEAFDDLPDENFGALGGAGAADLDKVTTKIAPAGIMTMCACGNCGVKNRIESSWQEVVMGSLGFPPPNWRVDQATGTLYPYVGCAAGGCNRELRIGYAPQELKRLVASGVENGYVNPQWVQQYSDQIKQAAGAARR